MVSGEFEYILEVIGVLVEVIAERLGLCSGNVLQVYIELRGRCKGTL